MIAIDTCVLVRFLSDDEPGQAKVSVSLMRDNSVFLANTVLLETEWVLRSRYKKNRTELLNFFRLLVEVKNVVLEDSHRFEKAIDWYALGADFADAMHLASCDGVEMYTFDQNFCKQARARGVAPDVRTLEA